jgi:hypothetical protein
MKILSQRKPILHFLKALLSRWRKIQDRLQEIACLQDGRQRTGAT